MKNLLILILVLFGFTAKAQTPLGSFDSTKTNEIKGSLKVNKDVYYSVPTDTLEATDTVYVYVRGAGGKLSVKRVTAGTLDTTSLSSRIDTKQSYSDTSTIDATRPWVNLNFHPQGGKNYGTTAILRTNDGFGWEMWANSTRRFGINSSTANTSLTVYSPLSTLGRYVMTANNSVGNTFSIVYPNGLIGRLILRDSTSASLAQLSQYSNGIFSFENNNIATSFKIYHNDNVCVGCDTANGTPTRKLTVDGTLGVVDTGVFLSKVRVVEQADADSVDNIAAFDAEGVMYKRSINTAPELTYDEITAKLTYPNNYREEKIVTGASSDRTPLLSVFTVDSYTDHNAIVYYTSIDSSYWMRIAKTEGIPYRNFALSGAGINYTNFITHKMINPGHRVSLKIMAGFNDHSGATADSIRARRQVVNGTIVAALNHWSKDTTLAGGGDVTRSGTWTVVDWNDYGGKGNNHALTATAGDSITYPFTDSTAYAVLFTAGGVRNSYSKNVVIKLDHVPIDTISLDSAAHELLLAGIRGGSTGTYRENIALMGYKISTTYGAHEYTIVNLDNDTMAVSHFGVLEPVTNSMDVQLFSIPTLSNTVAKYHTSYKADSAINSIRGGRPYYHFDLYPTTTNSWASQSPDPNHWDDTGHLGAYLVWKSVITPTLRPQAAVNAVSIGGEDLFRGSYNDVAKARIDSNGDGYFHDNTVTILKSGICFNCYPTDSVYVYRFKNKGRAYMYLQRNDTAFEFASSISGEADAQITWLISSFKTTNGTAKAWLPAKVMIGDPTGFNTITYQGNASIDSIYYAGNHWYNVIRSNSGYIIGTHLATPTPSSEWKFRVDPFDKVYINLPVLLSSVAEYADNAAALSAGLTAGMVYRTGDNLKIVH